MSNFADALCWLAQGDIDAAEPSLLPMETVVLVLLAAILLALLIRPQYRRRVVRLMRFEVSGAAGAGLNDETEAIVPSVPAESRGRRSDGLLGAARARERRLAFATGAALAVFVGCSLVVAWMSGGGARAAVLALAGAGGLASVPSLVNLNPASSRAAIIAATILACGGVAAAESIVERTAWVRDPDEIAGVLVFAAAFCAATLHRTLRPLVPALVILAAPLGSLLLVPALLQPWARECAPGVLSSDAAALAGGTLALLLWVGITAGVALSMRVLDVIADWQRKGILTDLALIGIFGLWLVALVVTSALEVNGTGRFSGRGVLIACAWTAISCAAYVVACSRTHGTQRGSTLLLLRVFDRTGRAQRALDAVQARWRTMGPVWQIGGPDLAQLNVDLFEITMYLAGRLHELFALATLSTADLSQRLRTPPSKDGRWTVEEIFCFNNRWFETVERLMLMSDVILIDVRGFSPQRRGTARELSLLNEHRLLTKALALGDERTDWAAVDALLGAEHEGARLRRVQLRTNRDVRSCLEQLAAMAAGPAPTS